MFPPSAALHIVGANPLQFTSLQEVFYVRVAHRSKTKVYAKKVSFVRVCCGCHEKSGCSTQQPNKCSKELNLCGCEQECPLCQFSFNPH